MDHHRPGVPSSQTLRDFGDYRQDEMLPHVRKAYGWMNRLDVVSLKTWLELWKMLDLLRWTQRGVGWTSRAVAATAELNYMDPYVDPGVGAAADGTPEWWQANMVPAIAAAYACDPALYSPPCPWPTEQDATPPRVFGSGSLGFTAADVVVQSSYAYGLATGLPTVMARSVEFLAWGQIDATDTAPFVSPDGLSATNFNAYGFDLTYHKYGTYAIAPASTAAEVRSPAKLGHIDAPAIESPPPAVFPNSSYRFSGAYAARPTIVLRFDVPGGLTHAT